MLAFPHYFQTGPTEYSNYQWFAKKEKTMFFNNPDMQRESPKNPLNHLLFNLVSDSHI